MNSTRTSSTTEIGNIPISIIFLTFNSASTIEKGLRSVESWAGAIFVVDSGSTDETLDIVQQYVPNEHILYHSFENYALQRNWAQENLPIKHEWVMHIDADEWVTPELYYSLNTLFSSGGIHHQLDGLLIKRRTVFMERWIRFGGHYPSYHLRVYRASKGQCENRLYDQHFVVNGKTKKVMFGDLIDPVTNDIDEFLRRHIRWAGLEAQEALQDKRQPQSKSVQARLTGTPIEQRRWARTSLYYRLPIFARAFGYFFFRYVLLLGFLDGRAGLVFHVLQGFWFRFYVDVKIWEIQHQKV